jgi:uncharacterized protein
MSSCKVAEINIYPVKSLGGISLQSAEATDRGFKYDRRWMIVDHEEKFVTQRTHPQMALIKTKISGNKLILGHKTKDISPLVIPIKAMSVETSVVTVWNDLIEARLVGKYADEWLSEALDVKCRIVFMPEEAQRFVDRTYSFQNEIVSFADAYPFLLIGQSSLDDLNYRLTEKILMNRFRPNLVVSVGKPFDEDNWAKIKIGDIIFYPVKPCSRCATITVNQETAEKEAEPLKTLAQYRTVDNKVLFGQNLLHDGSGTIKVGDEIEILETK